MALKSPLMPSPTGTLGSAFSPYTDSPHSPARFADFTSPTNLTSNRSSSQSDSLAPPSPYPQQIEPSPVESNGTEGTDIEDGAQEELKADEAEAKSSQQEQGDVEITSPSSSSAEQRPRIDTALPARVRSGSADDGPQSVIHIPPGFRDFESASPGRLTSPRDRPTGSNLSNNSNTVASPSTPEAIPLEESKRASTVSPVNTDVPRYMDRATPRAQTKQEADEEHNRRKSIRATSLEGIPEALDKDGDDNTSSPQVTAPSKTPSPTPATAAEVIPTPSTAQVEEQSEDEVAALRSALSECWTLCNTLAGLSSSHRMRTFKFTERTEIQELAWRNCWRLCQQLYENKDEDHQSQITPTLELCRDFCQSLFDARQRVDEASDSVLRVSFELNNHLYNSHGRNAPEAFNERTLDFYITLCHRLMKQRTSLPQETDSLLRACWSLAEMLFNLRQSARDNKLADEELLGSAVQACWELCDLFREGWTQVRPDRNTPRPTQTTFSSQENIFRSQSSASGGRSSSTMSNRKYHEAPAFPPETPITVFDDTSTANSSPEETSAPNILVLGPSNSSANGNLRGLNKHHGWSGGSGSISDVYSESAGSATSSTRTSSTATASDQDAKLLCLRYLLLKAGMNTGYVRTSSQQLPTYVKEMGDTAFGNLPWQMKVLTFYRRLVTNDKSMLTAHALPSRRVTALEAARAVRWLGDGEQWAWMRDMFRIVFGFGIDEAERRGGFIQV